MMDFNAANQDTSVVPAPHLRLDVDAMMGAIRGRFVEALGVMEEQATEHQVTDERTFTDAIAMAGQVKDLAKRIEKARKDTIAEPDAFVRGINKAVKPLKDKTDTIDGILRGKINTHQRKLEAERMEAERKTREEAAKAAAEQARLQREAEAAAKKAKQPPPPPPEPMPPPPAIPEQRVYRAETGASASIRRDWKGEVSDFAKLPDDYKIVNQVAINQAVKAGIRSIPGVRIFEAATTVIR